MAPDRRQSGVPGEGERRMMRRTSDADRERVARLLRRRWIEGYLSLETFELRLGRAYAAQHGPELGALVGDLPRLRSGAVALRDALGRWMDAAFPKRPVQITFPPASRTTGGFSWDAARSPTSFSTIARSRGGTPSCAETETPGCFWTSDPPTEPGSMAGGFARPRLQWETGSRSDTCTWCSRAVGA